MPWPWIAVYFVTMLMILPRDLLNTCHWTYYKNASNQLQSQSALRICEKGLWRWTTLLIHSSFIFTFENVRVFISPSVVFMVFRRGQGGAGRRGVGADNQFCTTTPATADHGDAPSTRVKIFLNEWKIFSICGCWVSHAGIRTILCNYIQGV